MHEAYRHIIDDGRSRFPEDLRVKAPRGARAAVAAAAQLRHTWYLLRSLEDDGVKLRRGAVEVEALSQGTPQSSPQKLGS